MALRREPTGVDEPVRISNVRVEDLRDIVAKLEGLVMRDESTAPIRFTVGDQVADNLQDIIGLDQTRIDNVVVSTRWSEVRIRFSGVWAYVSSHPKAEYRAAALEIVDILRRRPLTALHVLTDPGLLLLLVTGIPVSFGLSSLGQHLFKDTHHHSYWWSGLILVLPASVGFWFVGKRIRPVGPILLHPEHGNFWQRHQGMITLGCVVIMAVCAVAALVISIVR